jgi:diguanylate cyclase (GGDEF)-like protein
MRSGSRPPSFAVEGHAYRAGWTRVLLATLALTIAPVLIPELAKHRPVFGAYLALALLFQYLIKRDIGGSERAIAGGIVDIAVLTFLIHRVGSSSTLLVGLYVVLGIMMALVHTRRVAWVLAGLGSLAYAAVLLAETMRWLPYAPDATRWVPPNPPDAGVAASAALVVTMLLGISTTTVSNLVSAIREREEELRRVNQQLEEISQRDPLTQLYNRRRLVECLERELARARRGHTLSVLMIDLDHFKRVNDEHGHLKGDDVLLAISKAIASSIRAADIAGRYGGDEFVVVLPDTGKPHAIHVAERLVSAVREASAELETTVTASVGIAEAKIEDDVRGLLRRADESAYRAKQSGGDGVCIAA